MTYGSLVNRSMERQRGNRPEVGMGATACHHSDRTAGTIEAVDWKHNKVIVTVRADNARRTDNNGQSESQEYEYERNPNGAVYRFQAKLSNDGTAIGKWREMEINPKTGRLNIKSGGAGLSIGVRDQYYDFSF